MLIRICLLAVAAILVGAGWRQLDRFSSTPGDQRAAPARWPRDLPAEFSPEPLEAGSSQGVKTPTLLVFLHPRCSCSAATLEQLAQILEATRSPLKIALVVYRSRVVNDAEGSSALRDFVHEGSGHHDIRILHDANGALSRRFGAATSGEILLYAGDGRLLFQGGITPQRGHVGDSDGADELRNALATGAAQGRTASVFGCPIFHSAMAPVQGERE